VAPASLTETETGRAIAGWEHVVLHLSAGAAGLRNLMVVLDETGRPIAANDSVLYGTTPEDNDQGLVHYQHISIGGRFEPDGSFNGTCWDITGSESGSGEIVHSDMEKSAPTEAQIAKLRALVAELLDKAL